MPTQSIDSFEIFIYGEDIQVKLSSAPAWERRKTGHWWRPEPRPSRHCASGRLQRSREHLRVWWESWPSEWQQTRLSRWWPTDLPTLARVHKICTLLEPATYHLSSEYSCVRCFVSFRYVTKIVCLLCYIFCELNRIHNVLRPVLSRTLQFPTFHPSAAYWRRFTGQLYIAYSH